MGKQEKPDLPIITAKAGIKRKLRGCRQKTCPKQELADYLRSKYGREYVVRHHLIDRAIREMLHRGELRELPRNRVQLT